jgi:hypothetical protein
MDAPIHSDVGRGAVCTNVRPTRARKTAFLEAMTQLGNITAAARAVGIHRNTHYLWIDEANDSDGKYAKAFESAKEEYADSLRAEARRRAVEGVLEDVWYQGQVVGQRRVFSDRIFELELKAHCPEYRDKHEIAGDGGGPVRIAVVRFPVPIEDPEEWSQKFRAQEAHRRAALDQLYEHQE